MFDSTVRYHFVLNCLAQDDVNFKHYPSRDEWNKVEWMAWFLKPFNDITTLFSRIDYPTVNLFFHGVF